MKTLFNQQSVVAHPETGEVITLFNKMDSQGIDKTYGRVRIDAVTPIIQGGFVTAKKRTAFVTLDEDALNLLGDHIKQGEPYPIKGRVIVKETFEPQYENHSPKLNPITEDYVRVDGRLVYRTTEYCTDEDASDHLLSSYGASADAKEIKNSQQLIEDSLVS